MEKETFRRGLKRLGLVGILGASLMFSGIGIQEASAQSAANMQNNLNNWANDPKVSAKDREVYRQGASLYGNYAIQQAEDDAKKARWKSQEQTELLRKIEKQNREMLANAKKDNESSSSSSSSYTPSYAYTPTPAQNYSSVPRTENIIQVGKMTIKDETPNTDVFFTYQHYVDKNKDDAEWQQETSSKQRLLDYPHEFEGEGVKKLKIKEPFAFGAIFNKKKNSTYSLSVLHNGKEFFSERKSILKEKSVMTCEFENGANVSGEFTAVWKVDDNPTPVGLTKIIIEPGECAIKEYMQKLK